jgi:hypothetical protein
MPNTQELVDALNDKTLAFEAARDNWEDALEDFSNVWAKMCSAYEDAPRGQKKAASQAYEGDLVRAAKTFDGTVRSIGVAQTGIEIAAEKLRQHVKKNESKKLAAEYEETINLLLSNVSKIEKAAHFPLTAMQAVRQLDGLYF